MTSSIPHQTIGAPRSATTPRHWRQTRAMVLTRELGALTLFLVGAVHLREYIVDYYNVVPVIGPLFLLNFIGAVTLALVLIVPTERIVDRLVGWGSRGALMLVSLGAIAMSITAFTFLLISERTILFGFHEYGYRPAILIALAAEAATTVLLTAYVAMVALRPGKSGLSQTWRKARTAF